MDVLSRSPSQADEGAGLSRVPSRVAPLVGSLGFAQRLGLATSLLIVVVCGAHSWTLTQGGLRRYLTERGQAISQQLGREVARSLVRGEMDVLHQVAQQTRVRSGIVYARFYDPHGLMLASMGPAPIRSEPPRPSAFDGVVGPLEVAKDLWEFQAPIWKAVGDRAGTVTIGLPLDSFHALRESIIRTGTMFALFFTMIGVVSAVLLARAITRPLERLAAAADAIAAGDLETRVQVRTDDEMGTLARSFNTMAESLARSHAVLEEKVQELDAGNRLKLEFLATISHELRTPLNVIIGYAEMVTEDTGGRLTVQQEGLIAAIRRYATLQLELITNVLDFSRISSGKVSYHPEDFELGPVLADIGALYRSRLHPGVELRVLLEPGVPPMHTDRVKLQEIVRNLVENAVKFTGQGEVRVIGRPAPKEGTITIEVSDTGPGIAAGDLELIFEAFHQLGESSTRETTGVGLGLSIVKQLTDALGGWLSVSSVVGQGSTFRIDVPARLHPTDTPTELDPAPVALSGTARNVATATGFARSLQRARVADGRAE